MERKQNIAVVFKFEDQQSKIQRFNLQLYKTEKTRESSPLREKVIVDLFSANYSPNCFSNTPIIDLL